MCRYIALLRGINISGRNKISMSQLKTEFLELGCTDVVTHLNSGNVVFSAGHEDENLLAANIQQMIQARFCLDIPVFVMKQQALQELLSLAPAWWGTEDPRLYDNLIFVFPTTSATCIAEKIGEPTKELERICICDNGIFWSFDRAKYAKANWWKKTASTGIAELLTIRTAKTLRKIAEM